MNEQLVSNFLWNQFGWKWLVSNSYWDQLNGFTTNKENAGFMLIWVYQLIWYALHEIHGFKLSWSHLDERAHFKVIMEWAEYSLNFIPISESVLLSFYWINIFPPLGVKHIILTQCHIWNACLSSLCLFHCVCNSFFFVNTPPFSAKI